MTRRSQWLSPAPPTVAVEIAPRRVTVVELGGPIGKEVVSGYASEPLPPEAVTPALTGVNIAAPAVVVTAVRAALDRAGLRSARRIALVVPDSIARVTLLPFEQVPPRPADLEKLIRWQLKKSMPFSLDEARVSHFVASHNGQGSTIAAVVSRRDVVAQYEAIASTVGVHAGIVNLASFSVMNAVMAAAVSTGDALVVCLGFEATTLAILRGAQLMFYRHRPSVDEEPLSALVHQTAMYHQDRLGGERFERIWVSGAALTAGGLSGIDAMRRDLSERLGVTADAVDIRSRATLQGEQADSPEIRDALAASVGVLLREREAA